jgi:hypothetical protein
MGARRQPRCPFAARPWGRATNLIDATITKAPARAPDHSANHCVRQPPFELDTRGRRLAADRCNGGAIRQSGRDTPNAQG